MNTRVIYLWLLVAAVALPSCSKRPLAPLLPCTVTSNSEDVPVSNARNLDLLFVIDDSGSMAEEQIKLNNELTTMVENLLDGQVTVNGEMQTFPPVTSLKVGVVTSDMGVSTTNAPITDVCNADIATARCSDIGNVGETPPSPMKKTGLAACNNHAPSVGEEIAFQIDDTSVDRADFIADVRCVTEQGATGCGNEQPLSALVNAFRISEGRGNIGFLRPNALLAIVMVTDEDDCSTDDVAVFDLRDTPSTNMGEAICQNDPQQPALCGPYTADAAGTVCEDNPMSVKQEQRCSAFDDRLTAIQEFVTELTTPTQGVTVREPEDVIFAAITGVPILGSAEEYDDLQGILDDPRMNKTPAVAVDPNDACDETILGAGNCALPLDCPDVVAASCPGGVETVGCCLAAQVDTQNENLHPVCASAAGDGIAFPARRVVGTVNGLKEAGVGTVVSSICEDDFSPAVTAITGKIAEALRRFCLPRPLQRNSASEVPCEVIEVLATMNDTCDEAAGRFPMDPPLDEETGRPRCLVQQLPSVQGTVPTGAGWFYNDFTSERDVCSFRPPELRQIITLTREGAAGSRIRLECLSPVPPLNTDIGTTCSESTEAVDCGRTSESLEEQYDKEGLALRCETSRRTCQIPCDNDAACPGGFGCFPADTIAGGTGYCVNPTCTLN